ncbi:MAG: hypothetical protein DSZ03_00590 [Sulfurimonas sp.]|nr:MAG: hypothetical protein DSZ03_00590 [Sulfurimonas sp.]
MRSALLLFFFGIVFCPYVTAKEYALIAHPNTPPLNLKQIRAIYLKKLSRIDNIALVPLNLGAKDPLRQRFERHILHMSFQRLKSYWSQQHYLGHRPPLSMKSQQSLLSFVKHVEGAIAYIDACNIDNGVQVLYRWSD